MEAGSRRMDRRRTPTRGMLLIAVSAVCGSGVALRASRLDEARAAQEAELKATLQSLELTQRRVEAYWDSAGAPPASLEQLGLGPLPFRYRATGRDYRLTASSPFGGTVGYQSPEGRATRGDRTP